MSKAVYEKLEDGNFVGKIPPCSGVIVFGETLYQCQEELRSALEGWLIVKIRHGDKLPVIGRVDTIGKHHEKLTSKSSRLVERKRSPTSTVHGIQKTVGFCVSIRQANEKARKICG